MKNKILSPLNSGFSILELMVALGISVMILFGIIRVFGIVVSQSNKSMNQVGESLDVVSCFLKMETDFQGLFWVDGFSGFLTMKMPNHKWAGENWENVVVESKPSVESISEIADVNDLMIHERWGRAGCHLQLFVDHAGLGMEDPGGVYAISYQIRRMSIGSGGHPRYYFLRSEVSAHQTFDEGYAFEKSLYEQGEAIDSAVWGKSVIRHPNQNHVMLSNVIDFGVRIFHWNVSTGTWALEVADTNRLCQPHQCPRLVVVMLRVLDAKGADLIENIEQGRMPGDWWQIASQHSEVYTQQFVVSRELLK